MIHLYSTSFIIDFIVNTIGWLFVFSVWRMIVEWRMLKTKNRFRTLWIVETETLAHTLWMNLMARRHNKKTLKFLMVVRWCFCLVFRYWNRPNKEYLANMCNVWKIYELYEEYIDCMNYIWIIWAIYGLCEEYLKNICVSIWVCIFHPEPNQTDDVLSCK